MICLLNNSKITFLAQRWTIDSSTQKGFLSWVLKGCHPFRLKKRVFWNRRRSQIKAFDIFSALPSVDFPRDLHHHRGAEVVIFIKVFVIWKLKDQKNVESVIRVGAIFKSWKIKQNWKIVGYNFSNLTIAFQSSLNQTSIF